MKDRAFILILTFCVAFLAEARTTIHNPNAGGLNQVLSQVQIDTCTEVILTGELNSADLRLLRRMAGYKEHEEDKVGKLVYLDLSGVSFKSDKKPYLSVDAEKARLYLYQKNYYTSNLADHFQTPSVRTAGRVPDHQVAGTQLGGGNSWGYKKNFAVLDLPDTVELYFPDSYRMKSKQKKGICFQSLRHIRGHHLKKVNGEWIWSSRIRKGQFCYDMFYGCPNLKVIILPESGKCCKRVWVYKDNIKYYAK